MRAHTYSYIRRLMIVMAALLAVTAGAHADRPSSSLFYVPINRSELITTQADIAEVVVTDPAVANVLVHGNRKVSVIGLQIGQTTLRIFDADHKLLRNMDVYVTYDLPAVRKALKQFLPNETIGVSMVNTRMALTGEVTSASVASQAMEIAQEFIFGKLAAGAESSRAEYSGAAGAVSPILNMMKISAGQQVMLRIRIGEAQRAAVKNLGVNMQAVGDGNALPFSIGTGSGRAFETDDGLLFTPGSFTLADSTDSFAFTSASKRFGAIDLYGLIEALERNGMIKILAEPNLTALSGEEAQFLAGGEFPVVVPQEGGTFTVEYKPYGVALKFTPYVISPNRIRIQVNPEVSELSTENAITTLNGTLARSLVTRRASTTVELAPGESFMIAGLVSDTLSTNINQIPGAGDIPVLGALFRSTAFRRNETELVIAVTPYLVDPLKNSDVKLPSDNFRPASFMDSVFFGALSGTKGDKEPSLEGPSGFMTDN